MDVLVIGLGNILLEDEGIGVRVVEEFERCYQPDPAVEVIDGGTSAMDLLRPLEGRERVIILDAVKTGAAPGSLVRIPHEQVPKFFQTRISPHQLGLSDLLALLTIQGQAPENLSIIGMVPVSMTTRVGLSETAQEGLLPMVEMLADELRQLGVHLKLAPPHAEGYWAHAAQYGK